MSPPPSVPRPKYSLLGAASGGSRSRLTGAPPARCGADRRLLWPVARRLVGLLLPPRRRWRHWTSLPAASKWDRGRKGKEVPHLARFARRCKGPEEGAPRLLLQGSEFGGGGSRRVWVLTRGKRRREDGDLDKRDFTSGLGLASDGLGPCGTHCKIIKILIY
jgi:hypothetical protein